MTSHQRKKRLTVCRRKNQTTREEDDRKSQALICRRFSPVGRDLPCDFAQWFEIKSTPDYGGKRSKGVFTTRRIEKGLWLGEYRGQISYSHRQGHDKFFADASYVMAVKRQGKPDKYIDGIDPQTSSWTRFINSPNSGEQRNVLMLTYKDRAFAVAARAIPAGRQLLYRYKM